MKALSIVVTLFVMSFIAKASNVLEVNDLEKTVYFHQTPKVEVVFQDIDNQTGYLLVTLQYDGSLYEKDLSELASRYPDYHLVAMVARPVAEAQLRVGSVFVKNLPIKSGERGPYLNTYVELSRDEIKMVRAAYATSEPRILVDIPSVSEIETQRLVEEYVASGAVCDFKGARTVKGMIQWISQVTKPAEIKRESTFVNFKKTILDLCFDVETRTISSMSDLLALPLQTRRVDQIRAVTLEKSTKTIPFLIKSKVETVHQKIGE